MPLVVTDFFVVVASLTKWEKKREFFKNSDYYIEEKATIETSFNQNHWLWKRQHKICALKMQDSDKTVVCRILSFKQKWKYHFSILSTKKKNQPLCIQHSKWIQLNVSIGNLLRWLNFSFVNRKIVCSSTVECEANENHSHRCHSFVA